MKYEIQINKLPNQTGSFNIVNAEGQTLSCRYALRTLTNGLIMNLSINDKIVFNGRRCVDRMPLLLSNKYKGNLYWEDIYGNDNPNYKLFGVRFKLIFDTDFKL